MTDFTGAQANSGTVAVREGLEIDEAALSRWMRNHVQGFSGALRIEQFKGGLSNPTYRLASPAGAWVLRRKPPGPILKGAHAVEREARVLTALGGEGFPVAHVHGLCEDASVIGTPFYVMDMVEGRIFWDAAVGSVGTEERAELFDAMNATIAQLHRIDPVTAGLGDYGRPGNYFERQVGRWSRQYREDLEAGRSETMDRLIDWLETNMPDGDDETRVSHGDFRIDNMIFHPTEPRVLAVLDWELSTLGHPGADFAYHAMMYRMPPHIVAGLGDKDPAALGLPSEEEYVARYCERTGRDGMPHYDYYVAFNFFRLAAIFHGIKGRVIRGNASNAQSLDRVKVLPELIDLAWQQAERAGA